MHVITPDLRDIDIDIDDDTFDNECRKKRFAQHDNGECWAKENETESDNRCEDAMNIANGEEGKKKLIDSLTFFKTEGRILYPKEGVANIQDIIDNLDTKTGRVTIKSWNDGTKLEMELNNYVDKYIMRQTDGYKHDDDHTASSHITIRPTLGTKGHGRGTKKP